MANFKIIISEKELAEIGFALLMDWANTSDNRKKEIELLMHKLAEVAYRPLQVCYRPLEEEEEEEE